MLAYADNLNVVGTDCEAVQRAKDSAVAHLRSLGFVIHEELDATSSANSLGFFIDGVAGRVSPIPQKVSKVIAALRWLQRRPRITGKFIEKIIGHCVHFFLLRRELLSVFRRLYQFVQDSYLKRQRLWRSAATEAGWAASLLSISFADLRREWNPTLIATDASLSGIAVSSCCSTTSQVSTIGKVKENWRFKVKAPIAPRKKTVQHVDVSQGLDPFLDVETVKPVTRLREDLFELDEFFPEIPETLMATENWKLQFAAQMKIREAITILEMRGILAGLRHNLRSRENFGKRHVVLNDNLAAVLCTSKGRSSVFPMLRGCRRLCALLVATNSALTVRWVPSEWNPADHGSRLWEPWRVASRRALKEEGEKVLEEVNRCCYPRSDVVSQGYHKTKTAGCVKKQTFVEPPAQEHDQNTVGREFPRGKVTEEKIFPGLLHTQTSISRTDLPGADGNQCRGSNRLHDSVSGFPTFCEGESLQPGHTKEFGQQLQLLSESFVLRRSRCQRGLQSARSSARCTPRLWGEARASPEQALPPGLGQDRSGPNQTSSSISCGGNARWAHDRFRMPRGCSSHSVDVQLLLETKRDAVDQGGRPIVAPTKMHPYVALNLHPEERLETSKMNMSNESILLDSPVLPSLGMMLMKLVKVKKGNDLFTLDYAQLRHIWEKALTLSHLPKNYAVLYQLRHAGPSHDRLHKLRSALAVKLRGRWQSDSSVRRYEQHARIQKEMEKLPKKVRDAALKAVNTLEQKVLRCSIP